MIGLGRMGANMVRRLLRGGHECAVYNRSPEPVAELVKEKAVGAASQTGLNFETPDDIVCGVDEAGRGPLAGPVVAAAVIFDPSKPMIRGLDDSKVLTAKSATSYTTKSSSGRWLIASRQPLSKKSIR